MSEPQITVRSFARLQDMHVCEDMQRSVWQFADLEIVPYQIFVVAQKTGGEVLGAFDGNRAIGFSLAFSAHRRNRIYLHSHMTAVLPEYQSQGVGRKLKLAQRENAISRGIDLIEWTFDPLQLRNAYFNIERLGAIVRHYETDLYGTTSSNLHRGLPTDRFVAEWWLRFPRVEVGVAGGKREISGKQERVSVPGEIESIARSDPQRALQIQSQLRNEFQQLFQQSYAVTGFVAGEWPGELRLADLE